jgi:predicted RNA-binding protein
MLSNAGVVPREFEDMYPFNAYDWDEKLETEETKRRYIEVTRKRIKSYLSCHRDNYKMVACFLKYSSESYQALDAACRELGIEFRNLLSKETYEKIKDQGKPLQKNEALDDLLDGINGLNA